MEWAWRVPLPHSGEALRRLLPPLLAAFELLDRRSRATDVPDSEVGVGLVAALPEESPGNREMEDRHRRGGGWSR